MIKIIIPNNNIPERKYIIDVFFKEFLGVNYQIVKSVESQNWKIELTNGSFLIFEDHFFNNYLEVKRYLKIENIPRKIQFTQNEFLIEKDIPIIYGNSTLKKKTKSLYCGVDVFASSFFMLTRWEEYVNKTRDSHNRFFTKESLAFENNFLDRPIVNEYLEMLKSMIIYLDPNGKIKRREFSFHLSHDVDNPLYFSSFKSRLKETYFLLREKKVKEVFNLLYSKVLTHLNLTKDPFDTFDYLMRLSEGINTKSNFFFMAQGTSMFDSNYSLQSKFIQKLTKNIILRGHNIGIHPSYNSYNDVKILEKEKAYLEKNINLNINFGRQHYLRFEVPTTWQVWEDNGMEYDSTCGYADKEGFRCGICYEFSVFNILTRKHLKLKEKPLIVMDGSFEKYQKGITSEEMRNKIIYLLEKVKKYNGEFVFLWHNSSFNVKRWEQYNDVYESILK